ncbi:MAG TPA: CBS domain-containing protein [Nitrolancea sp.]|nr:CBS domain-containing protein [Nitrolancea sp.]
MGARRAAANPNVLYLSQILGKHILDVQGEPIGRIQDVVVQFGSGPHPPVKGLVARQGQRDFYLDWSQVAELAPRGARLATPKVDLRAFERRPGEVLLRKDVLDKQLIDVNGRRLVRANDLELARVYGRYRLVGVDVGFQAIARRLGPRALAARFRGSRLIDWANVESFTTDVPTVRLRVPHARVARLHPVEIAQIMEDLAPRQSQEVLASLDDETAAEAMQEMDPDDAADLLERLNQERAADILEEMEPDDAADVLAEMDEERAAALLHLMEPDEAADVRELLTYEEDSAAGMMTTEFVVLPRHLTAADTLRRLRELEEPPEQLYDLYVIDAFDNQRLAGVVPLRDLILAPPEATLSALAQPAHPVSPGISAREAAAIMAEYNLVMLPVVDEDEHLLGVVSVDDAMELLLPEPHEWLAPSRIFRQ